MNPTEDERRVLNCLGDPRAPKVITDEHTCASVCRLPLDRARNALSNLAANEAIEMMQPVRKANGDVATPGRWLITNSGRKLRRS